MLFQTFLIINILLSPWWVMAAAPPPLANSGGSLVLVGEQGTLGRAREGIFRTELEQEVRVFMKRHRVRGWPEVSYVRPLTVCRSFSGRAFLNSPQLAGLIYKYASFYGVEEALVRAVIRHESGGNSQAVSPKGAQGLMQLMPGTAILMGVRNPFDPEENIAGGVGYLRRCLERFGHNVPLAVAAYNAGPERVAQYSGVPPFAETQLFVRNVMDSYLGQEPFGHKGLSVSSGGKSLPFTTLAQTPSLGKRPRAGAQSQQSRASGPKVIEVRFPDARRAKANRNGL